MAFTFKLGNPTDEVKPDVCRVPQWLEEHINAVNSEYDESALGNVDNALIRTEPFNYSQNCQEFGDYYDYRNQRPSSYQQNVNPVRADGSGFWEVRECEFRFKNNGNDAGNGNHAGNGQIPPPIVLDRPVHPKLFCDNLYMKLMNILYLVSEEKQAASIQSRFNGMLDNLEKQFLNQ